MTIQLAATPIDPAQMSLLDEITDTSSPLGSLHRADFEAACRQDGASNGGVIHPSRVSAILHARFGEINSRALSAAWAGACGPRGFMDKCDTWLPIDPEFSKGNGAKAVRARVLRGVAS